VIDHTAGGPSPSRDMESLVTRTDRTSVEHPPPLAIVRYRPRTYADQAKSFATVRDRPGRAYLQAGGRGFESHRLHPA